MIKENMTKKILLIYLAIWALSVLSFWIFPNQDEMGYTLLVFYIVLPLSAFISTLLIGKNTNYSNTKLLMPLLIGFMHMLAEYLTFSLANMLSFHKLNAPTYIMMVNGIIISSIGLMIGIFMKKQNIKIIKNNIK